MITKRTVISVVAGWVTGGLTFALWFHKPLEPLSAVVAFSTTLLMLWAL